ncbi:MAG: hypothetical protein JW940_39580 [Polyangiaceae bacterium]|nr:hypothetical protein [Polyangiaceae bacterium]
MQHEHGPHPRYRHESAARLTPLFFEVIGSGAVGSASGKDWPESTSSSSSESESPDGFTGYLAAEAGLRTIVASRVLVAAHYGYHWMSYKYPNISDQLTEQYFQGNLQLGVPVWVDETTSPSWIPSTTTPGVAAEYTEIVVPSYWHVSLVSGFRVAHAGKDRAYAVPFGIRAGRRTLITRATSQKNYAMEDDVAVEARALLHFPDPRPGVDVSLIGSGNTFGSPGAVFALYFEYIPALRSWSGSDRPPQDGLPTHRTVLFGLRFGFNTAMGI